MIYLFYLGLWFIYHQYQTPVAVWLNSLYGLYTWQLNNCDCAATYSLGKCTRKSNAYSEFGSYCSMPRHSFKNTIGLLSFLFTRYSRCHLDLEIRGPLYPKYHLYKWNETVCVKCLCLKGLTMGYSSSVDRKSSWIYSGVHGITA